MDRSPLIDPAAPLAYVYVLGAIAAVFVLGWLITRLQLAATRSDLDVARAAKWRSDMDHAAELEAERRRRLNIDRSRTDAQLELAKYRALCRTLAHELDKRTSPRGWSFDGRTPEDMPARERHGVI